MFAWTWRLKLLGRRQMIKIKWMQIMLIILMMSVGCASQSTEQTNEKEALEIIDLLVEGDYQNVYSDYFSKDLKKSFPVTNLIQEWEKYIESNGKYLETNIINMSQKGQDYVVVESEVLYTKISMHVRMTFNKENYLVGLHISAGDKVEKIDPDILEEEELIIGEGTSYELGGTLTLPKQIQGKLPAVVLVHGSGPSDRDEAVFAYKPFRDIAWRLAEKGIAVLRYDKRTFTYANEMSSEEIKRFTVYEETVEDAILAGQFLNADDRIDNENIYVIGHSLGGMLAPRIVVEGDIFAGFVSLAGSPRSLWEIIYDQNLAVLQDITDKKERQRQKQLMDDQLEKAKKMEEMSSEEALTETVFGLPAHYLKEMDQFDAGKIAYDIDLPILMLQGEDDFQVDLEKDFNHWHDLLGDKENATFISYPGLNHFFINYEGIGKGTIVEYDVPGTVDVDMMDDLAEWILENSS